MGLFLRLCREACSILHVGQLLQPCCCCCLVAMSCPTLCNPTDCSLSGSSVHGISQARILKWVAISFSRGSSQTRGQTCVYCLAGGFFTTEPPGKPKREKANLQKPLLHNLPEPLRVQRHRFLDKLQQKRLLGKGMAKS